MVILGIETSCDETAVSLVQGKLNSKLPLTILSSVVASSAELLAKYGGIIPEQAARQQVLAMIPTLCECLKNHFGSDWNKVLKTGKGIEKIAITTGPGLIGSLLVGVETARTLSYAWNIPIICVNHLVAHLYANWIEKEVPRESRVPQVSKVNEVPEFPAIGLVVSGGHTDMVLINNHHRISLIGRTKDDAAGECFDKSARLLGLPYPGGPMIGKLAGRWIEDNPSTNKNYLKMFPRPMIEDDNFDWSFSGLKTSVLYKMRDLSENDKNDETIKRKLAAEIQEAICDCLVTKLARAIEKFKPKSVLIAGGVAANQRLTIKLKNITESKKWKLFIPEPKLCTDNGSYIAAYAFYHNKPISWKEVDINPSLTILDK